MTSKDRDIHRDGVMCDREREVLVYQPPSPDSDEVRLVALHRVLQDRTLQEGCHLVCPAAQIGRSVAAASEETSLRPWPTVNTLRPCDCKPEMLTDSLKAQDQLSAFRRNINMASTRFLTLAFRLMPVM